MLYTRAHCPRHDTYMHVAIKFHIKSHAHTHRSMTPIASISSHPQRHHTRLHNQHGRVAGTQYNIAHLIQPPYNEHTVVT